MSDRPPFVVRSADVPEEEGAYRPPFDGEKLSFGRNLGAALGTRGLGVWVERLPPGRRTSFTHAHSAEEELVYVLSGAPSVRWCAPDGSLVPEMREHTLAPGDTVAFPPGTGIAHTFVNRSDSDAELLVVGQRTPGDRVTYPEDPLYQAWLDEHMPMRSWPAAGAEPEPDALPPAVRIETERLVLRPWTTADVRDLRAAQIRNRDHLLPWMPWAQTPPSLDELVARISDWSRGAPTGNDVVYGVFSPDGRIVGGTGLHDRVGPRSREIGYWIDHAYQGQGLVTEWVAALVRVGFELLGLARMEIHCDPANTRSSAVALRLGFTLEATLPKRIPGVTGELEDSAVYAAYQDDHAASPSVSRPIRAFDAAGRRLL